MNAIYILCLDLSTQITTTEPESLKSNLRRTLRGGNIISEESTIGTVCFLFDRHREFLQVLALKAALSEYSRKLSGKSTLVPITREECNRLATFPSSAY